MCANKSSRKSRFYREEIDNHVPGAKTAPRSRRADGKYGLVIFV